MLEVRNKVPGVVSGKDYDASMWSAGFDIRNDALDVGRRKTGVRWNDEIKLLARHVLKDIRESIMGLHSCYIAAMFPENSLKTRSKFLPLCDDENVVNGSPLYYE